MHRKAYPETLDNSYHDPNGIGRSLRAHTLKAKYYQIDIATAELKRLFEYIGDLDQFYASSHFCYLVDLILLNVSPPNSLIEYLYERISNILTKEGYGTIIDQAKLIILRRRWWVLHL